MPLFGEIRFSRIHCIHVICIQYKITRVVSCSSAEILISCAHLTNPQFVQYLESGKTYPRQHQYNGYGQKKLKVYDLLLIPKSNWPTATQCLASMYYHHCPY